MLSRTSTLQHKMSGVALQTPLLIPSFSSKGFAHSRESGKSEIAQIMETSGEFLTETCLISAYDIHYNHIPGPADLPFRPELLVLDSGGYDISTDRDYSSVIDPLPAPGEWSVAIWQSVVASFPDDLPLVIVSYDHQDHRAPFDEQVARARERFAPHGQHLHSFLLKPETKSQTTLDSALKKAGANAKALGLFDVVGITEKELGRSMLDRMARTALLRRAMDEAGVTAPLHIFGALDPLSVCLYFLSGAEMFDGLTWIRYGYEDGRCLYTHNLGPLKYGLDATDNAIKSRTLFGNYYFLQDLQRRLREFEMTKNFTKLQPHSALLSDAHDSLRTRLKGAI